MDMGGLQNKEVFIVSPGLAHVNLVLGTGTISPHGHETIFCLVSDNPEPAGQSGSLLLVPSECL